MIFKGSFSSYLSEMDDVEITDVEDGDMPYHVEKPVIKNQDLSSVTELGKFTLYQKNEAAGSVW